MDIRLFLPNAAVSTEQNERRRIIGLHSPWAVHPLFALQVAWLGLLYSFALSLCKTFLGLKCSGLPFTRLLLQGQIIEEFKLLVKIVENGVALFYVVLRTFHSLWCKTVIFNGWEVTYTPLTSLLRYSSWNSVSMRFFMGPLPMY